MLLLPHQSLSSRNPDDDKSDNIFACYGFHTKKDISDETHDYKIK